MGEIGTPLDEFFLDLEKRKDNIFDKIFPHGIFDMRASYILLRPWEIAEEIWHRIKWAWQRVYKGWDNRVVWSIDAHLARMIPIWIRKLKEDKCGVPMMMFQESDCNSEDNWSISEEVTNKRNEEYNAILDEIAEGFEAYLERGSWSDEENELLTQKFNRGMELFVKYFETFWD